MDPESQHGSRYGVVVGYCYVLPIEVELILTSHFHDVTPPPGSIVVRASARGAGGRGLIPDSVTPKT